MNRLLPLVMFALVACEPREDPNSPEVEAAPSVTAPAQASMAAPPPPPPTAAPAPAPAPAASASAASGPLTCGDKQCAANQICIEVQTGPGNVQKDAPPPAATTSFVCANEPQKSAGFTCTEPKDRRQHCQALVPAAPH
jgi:hypothetical protein